MKELLLAICDLVENNDRKTVVTVLKLAAAILDNVSYVRDDAITAIISAVGEGGDNA